MHDLNFVEIARGPSFEHRSDPYNPFTHTKLRSNPALAASKIAGELYRPNPLHVNYPGAGTFVEGSGRIPKQNRGLHNSCFKSAQSEH